MIDLLSENNTLFKANLNNSLGSTCKLTSPDIQNEILDIVVQVCQKYAVLEIKSN